MAEDLNYQLEGTVGPCEIPDTTESPYAVFVEVYGQDKTNQQGFFMVAFHAVLLLVGVVAIFILA